MSRSFRLSALAVALSALVGVSVACATADALVGSGDAAAADAGTTAGVGDGAALGDRDAGPLAADGAVDGAAPAGDVEVVPDAWTGPWTCPQDMALVETGTVTACVDRYEAARQDATWYDAGADESRAANRAGVLPWSVGDDRATAESACVAAGKRLCGADEWEAACAGPDERAYPYGDIYRDDVCNGFEAHGPSGFKIVPTGEMDHCESGFGVFDMSGNLWELVRTDDALVPRGGAYDSTDGAYTHRCSFVRSGGRVEAVGFRCCAAPTPLR